MHDARNQFQVWVRSYDVCIDVCHVSALHTYINRDQVGRVDIYITQATRHDYTIRKPPSSWLWYVQA